jgi:predicted O-methyltransferase YrrM
MRNGWADVDAYVSERLVGADPALDGALADAEAAGLPAIDVSPPQGKLLHLLTRLVGARTVLELGTLAGYSTIWLARALPADGLVVTVEIEPRYAEVARANLERAGLESLVDARVGAALDVLPAIEAEGLGPFDLVFVDADKRNSPSYFDWALRLTRPGSVIIVDNVVRGGGVLAGNDEWSRASREVVERLAAEPRVDATVIQTVGSKGWDGFALAVVR